MHFIQLIKIKWMQFNYQQENKKPRKYIEVF